MTLASCLDENSLMDLALSIEGCSQEFKEHMAGCANCRQRFEEFCTLVRGVHLLSSASADLAIRPRRSSDDGHPSSIDKYFVLGTMQERESVVVYRGVHSLIPSDEVSIILARNPWAKSEEAINRLRSACLPLGRFKHPRIARAVDIGLWQDRPYLLVEYASGLSLDRVLLNRAFSRRDAARISVQLASALSAAHTAGIVHGMLNLQSIVLDEQDVPKIIDFGISNLFENPSSVDRQADIAALVGIVNQLSPEVLSSSGTGPADMSALETTLHRQARSSLVRRLFRQ